MVAWVALAVALLCLTLIVLQAVVCWMIASRLRPALGLLGLASGSSPSEQAGMSEVDKYGIGL